MKEYTKEIFEERYYKESGNVNLISVLGAIVVVLSTIIGIGWIYGYLSYYYPFPVYNIIMTILYVAIIGSSMSLSIKWFKIRNQKFSYKLSLILGVIAIYVSWMWFVTAGVGSFVWNPVDMVEAVSAKEIWWGVYLAWFLEAVFILFGMWVGVKENSAGPFCETCNKWIEKIEVKHIEPTDEAVLVDELEKNNIDYLLSLNSTSEVAHEQIKVKLYSCQSCKEQHYLTVEKLTVVMGNNGKPKEDSCRTIIKHLIVTQNDMNKLLDWGKSKSIANKT